MNANRLRDEIERLRSAEGRIDREQVGRILEGLLAETDRLAREQSMLDGRLGRVEGSVVFRLARWIGQTAGHTALRLGRTESFDYAAWIQRHERERPPGADGPTVSVLLPVYQPRADWLEAAVASVRAQSYSRWELCICGADAWPPDPRIRGVRLEGPPGIAASLNRAGENASGDYVTFLDQDDVLAPHALAWIASAAQGADVLYGDEDLIDAAGAPVRPIFKPDWSPDLLASCMYLGHPLVVSRAFLDRVGWFRGDYDGAQDYDLALRLADSGARIKHIPRVLYHWRQHKASTAGRPEAKPAAIAAGRRALESAVRRRGLCAAVEPGRKPFAYSLRRKPAGAALASIIVCSRNRALLRRCLGAVDARTAYPRREIVVVEHGFRDALGDVRVPWTGPFDFASMNNLAAKAASGDVLVFLNDDVTPLEPEWLDALVGQVERPGVGIAGALLEYPGGTLQHAGVVVGIADAAAHPLRNLFDSPLWNWAKLTRNVSAVTGACLAIRKSVFEQLAGFDGAFPVNYNDVDLCLRARQAGYEVILESRARLRHDEARSRDSRTSYAERRLFFERWREIIDAGDRYYTPHLSRTWETPRLDWETR